MQSVGRSIQKGPRSLDVVLQPVQEIQQEKNLGKTKGIAILVIRHHP